MPDGQPRSNIEDVQRFWNENPLFTGESLHAPGTPEWFEDHRRVIIEDGYLGRFDERFLPPPGNRDRVLDLGCGPGFWTVELLQRCKIGAMTSVDLTERALALTRARLDHYGLDARLQVENAEKLSFADASFDHVNCQGVIHHTPNTEQAAAEIARVLRPGGTASLSVYYRNVLLRNWRHISHVGTLLARFGAGLRGRGREAIYRQGDVDEIVRLYDGAENPIGKAYDRAQFVAMLQPHFDVEEIYYHYFPARSLPWRIPRWLHKGLAAQLPFMIFATVRRR